jgi:acetyltransferase-like isoleucine patch superfamily enzyme
MASALLMTTATARLMAAAPLMATAPVLTRIRESLREVIQRLRRQYFNRVWQMQLGEGSVVSFSAKLDKTNPRGLHIGKYTVVTFGAAILTHDYVNNVTRDVYIGDDCFIGAHAIILPGVRIGNNCIVAAATVVARDVPSGCLVAGNPARVVETNVKTTHYGVRVSVTPQEMPILNEVTKVPSF